MDDFMTSTHRTNWIFTPQDINDKYNAANQRAKQALEKYGTTRMEVDIDGSFLYAETQNDAKYSAEKCPKPLKVEEEPLLRAFYEFKIQDVCDAFKFPRKIQATALIYFKRFYLQWSVMEHHPKNIMLTSIYAACKAEANHVSAEELGKGIGQDHHEILNKMRCWFYFFRHGFCLKSLGFDLIVYAPYHTLDGFISDLEEFCGAKDDDQIVALKASLETARMEADKIMRTNGPLLFPPGQLALAALRRANTEHVIFDFESYLRSVLSRHHPAHTISELTASINAIDSLIGKLVTPTSKDVKHIDRKLKSCLEPGSYDKYIYQL